MYSIFEVEYDNVIYEVEAEYITNNDNFDHAFGTEQRKSYAPVSFKLYSDNALLTPTCPDFKRFIWRQCDAKSSEL